MTVAHIDINSGYPWVDEFFGHPHEYWPLYLLASIVAASIVYLLWKVNQ